MELGYLHSLTEFDLTAETSKTIREAAGDGLSDNTATVYLRGGSGGETGLAAIFRY